MSVNVVDEMYLGDAMQKNLKVLTYMRVLLAVTFGAVAGILGLTGSAGFALWGGSFGLASVLVVVKATAAQVPRAVGGGTVGNSGFAGFFASGWNHLTALSQSFLTYVLFWTLFRNVAHVY
ncbi:uncharacterized protein AMSG_10635 [Thecamonas trahens ATCC 50062]|uniref:ER membrane protein complex subunit 6 n=1 Tax=Thecamonas trahens ATCC 50062 TaxID=461836 RepID=A0A0L0DRT2_THETB|nr:hypothetical protein AMSG_10635 [Thecamonas trahens ATCC 50062]KNC55039.1 hypothetical protein AMSG_10635 [Thecamonas trahens ATCC 50062]|eukprot:XP_013753345.1 hypothetical protein AMSG_10635 [Thecamonas trahens ATCC 50062]